METQQGGQRQPGSVVAPGIDSALSLASCAISFLPAAPQACQRVGGGEGEVVNCGEGGRPPSHQSDSWTCMGEGKWADGSKL